MEGKFAYRWVAVACILLFLFRFFGDDAQKQPVPSGEIQIQGYVSGLPSYATTHDSFDFVSQEGGLLRLTWYGPRPLLQPGTGWKFWVKLKDFDRQSASKSFDYDLYLKRRGYEGAGSVEALKPWARAFAVDHEDLLNAWRFALRRKILFYAHAAGVAEASPLLLALGIGDSSELSSRMWRVLQDTGTSHLVAISGLHIGLIGLLFYWLMRRLWALSFDLSHRLAAQKAASVAGFLGAMGYGLISGLGIPAERTLIMLGMVAIYQFFGKMGGSFKGWLMAFLICLAWQPWGVFSLSFWLSFLAVFSLIYLLSHRIRLGHGIIHHLWFQFALSWLLVPITLYSFGMMSSGAFFVNLWAIPLVSFGVVPILFLGMILMALPSVLNMLPGACFYLAGKGAMAWWWGLEWFAHLPYAGIYLNFPSLGEMLLAQIGMFWIFAPRGIPGRALGILCTVPMFLTALGG